MSSERAMLKLVEGSGVRLRGGRLIVDPQQANDRLSRSGVNRDALPLRVAQINEILARHQARVSRLFSRAELDLERDRVEGESASGQELGDQNLFYLISFRQPGEDMLDALEELNALDVVEQAAPKGKLSLPSPTPSYVPDQDYLDAAPDGVGAGQMHLVAGGLGEGVKIADVEEGWQVTHEDLPAVLSVSDNSNSPSDKDHGTAVLGILAGVSNSFGVNGIAREADIHLVGLLNGNVADAIDIAQGLLRSGDVLLIEQSHNYYGDGIPVEYELDNYVAIQNATARRRIVIEPAGNGRLDLDSFLDHQFDPDVYDSGAIMVGAGMNSSRSPWLTVSELEGSCVGERVNVQGWGEGVVTTGYGDLFSGDSTADRKYTSTFRGTSAASAMVAGVAAAVQGVRRARELPDLTPAEMRTRLIAHSTAQGPGLHIGPLPNLASIIASTAMAAPAITATGTSSAVTISWTAVPGASKYDVYRKTSKSAAWSLIHSGSTVGYTDTDVISGKAYLYQAKALDGLDNDSSGSNIDLATAISFTDSTLTAGTPVKAKHIVELRAAANELCTFAGATHCASPPFTTNEVTESYVQGQPVAAADFTNLRTSLESLRSVIGVPAATFHEAVAAGSPIKPLHVEDLRSATD